MNLSLSWILTSFVTLLLNQNRNAACGKHRQEILCQLREMAKTEPNFDDFVKDLKPHFELEPQGNYQLKDSSRGLEHYVDPALGSFHEVNHPERVIDIWSLNSLFSFFCCRQYIFSQSTYDYGEKLL